METIVLDLSQVYGYQMAQNKVKTWFEEYSEFFYDSHTKDVLFFKKRIDPNWTVNNNSINHYKL
jgi:hypothetical protein